MFIAANYTQKMPFASVPCIMKKKEEKQSNKAD